MGAADARAATVTSGTALVFTAASGEENRVTVSVDGGQLTFTDTGAALTPDGVGCIAKVAHVVVCDVPLGSTPAVRADLGDMSDSATVLRGAADLTGGSGDDVLTGGHEGDTLTGGSGDDLIDGGAGADVLDGGSGEDTLDHSHPERGGVGGPASPRPQQGGGGGGGRHPGGG